MARMGKNFEKKIKDFEKKLAGNVPVGKSEKETKQNLEDHFKKAGAKPNKGGIRKLAREIHKGH